MKVEIWHLNQRQDGPNTYHKVSTLDVCSVTDEATCDLALIHTSADGMSQMHENALRSSRAGDIFVLIDDGTVSDRAYELSKDPDLGTLKYTVVKFNR